MTARTRFLGGGGRMAVTIKEIAKRSGFSGQTVSRVLNPHFSESHSPETRERVLSVARELGYKPNRHARQMRQGRFGAAAILTNSADSESALSNSLLWGVQTALAERDMNLTFALLSDPRLIAREGEADAATPANGLDDFLTEWMADGFLVHFSDDLSAERRARLHALRVPFVWINFDEDADCIYYDDREGAREATRYLLSLGHERVAYYGFRGVTHYSGAARREGYEETMRGAGRTPRLLNGPAEHVPNSEHWARWVDGVLSDPNRPTAVLCYGIEIAWSLIHVAGRRGLAVPRDLSVMAFRRDDGAWAGTQLTSMLLRERNMGQSAVELLMEKIRKPGVPIAPVVLKEPLEVQQTTAPPPA
jgi:DNA-binding LacI/PurR family transcriptional regulator